MQVVARDKKREIEKIDAKSFLKQIEEKYYVRVATHRITADAINGYGRLTKYVAEYYIICDRCHKCGYVPMVHGGDEYKYEPCCKSRHAWDRGFELILSRGIGFTEEEAIDNSIIHIDHIPYDWRVKHLSGDDALPPKKQFLFPSEAESFEERRNHYFATVPQGNGYFAKGEKTLTAIMEEIIVTA